MQVTHKFPDVKVREMIGDGMIKYVQIYNYIYMHVRVFACLIWENNPHSRPSAIV